MRSIAIAALVAALCIAGQSCAADPKDKGVWTDAGDPTLPVDFKIQGEYVNEGLGIQVIALGKGEFQAVVYLGGLPGAGWDGKSKSLMAGKFDGESATFEPAIGMRKYLAQKPDEFSATAKFPPANHQPFTGKTNGESFTVQNANGLPTELKKTVRKSPTLGVKAPAGAVVLFDGSSKDEWTGGRVDEKTRFLNTDGADIKTKKNFNNYTAHLEFMLPYKPDGRSQGRGNSGFYQINMYEVQILDSFGLDGKNNECGGVYSKIEPKLNMCLPPLVWQTYDVEFTNALIEGGKKAKNSRLTLKLNGVTIHDNVEIDGKTGGARGDPEGTPGPLLLQGHGNPLQFQNVWVVEKK